MAKDAANSLKYYLSISLENQDDLARIRQWSNLRIGFDESVIWVRDFDYAQIHSADVKSIPFKSLFYEKDNKLFLLHSNLPDRNVPSVLWTTIDRALPVKLPSLNHNYFGISERIQIQLIPNDTETDATVIVTPLDVLGRYIETAPSVRLEKIRWTIVNKDKAVLLGTPLLPVPGETFWQRKDFLLPTGFDFELFSLTDVIQKKVNPGRSHWVLWNTDNTYSILAKEEWLPLSRSSFRLTMEQLSQNAS